MGPCKISLMEKVLEPQYFRNGGGGAFTCKGHKGGVAQTGIVAEVDTVWKPLATARPGDVGSQGSEDHTPAAPHPARPGPVPAVRSPGIKADPSKEGAVRSFGAGGEPDLNVPRPPRCPAQVPPSLPCSLPLSIEARFPAPGRANMGLRHPCASLPVRSHWPPCSPGWDLLPPVLPQTDCGVLTKCTLPCEVLPLPVKGGGLCLTVWASVHVRQSLSG